MQARTIFLFGIVLWLCSWESSAQVSPNAPGTPAAQRVRVTADAVAATYDQATGLFQGTGWWNSANGITALANVSRDLPSHSYDAIFEHTYTTAQHRFPNFLNEFYDDEGWWALAWLDAYGVRNDPRYLAQARSIFADMTGGWSDTCGGGIWWKKNEHYKNAIANELFLSVAVRLAMVSEGEAKDQYVAWAQKEADWFLRSGMVNTDSLVNDGLDSACHNNGKTTWTYNQGVLLAGLAGLASLGNEPALLDKAHGIAMAVASHLVDKDGVLHDVCEPQCGEDGVQFKGILVRNLAILLRVAPSPEIAKLLKANGESVWRRARTPQTRFSVDWAGPPANGGTGSLISALDALTAALAQTPEAVPATRPASQR